MRLLVYTLAYADEKWRCAHFEQRARQCDSWKILRSTLLAVLSPKATLGVALPPRGAGAAVAPAKSAKAASRGTKCHGVPNCGARGK